MGALHEGHASLIRKARKENDIVTVSIFVNPLQFGKNEDFKKYPRPMRNDIGICRQNDVDYVFHPDARQFCRADSLTEVGVKKISDVYCGKFRQGHFKGVATIVLKLFNVIQPANVYFGEKDFQQLFIIKKLVRDLNVPVRIIACPTVREKTGLAISSRNAYLNECEKQLAPLIYGTLQEARKKVIRGGLKTAAGVRKFVRTKLSPLIKGVRGLSSSPLKNKLRNVIESFYDGLVSIGRKERFAGVIALTALLWAICSFGLYLGLKSVNIQLNFWQSVFMLSMTGVAAVIPAAPGSLGTMEYFVILGLGIFGIEGNHAFSFAVIHRFFSWFSPVLLGMLVLIKNQLSFGDLKKKATQN